MSIHDSMSRLLMTIFPYINDVQMLPQRGPGFFRTNQEAFFLKLGSWPWQEKLHPRRIHFDTQPFGKYHSQSGPRCVLDLFEGYLSKDTGTLNETLAQ